MAKSEIDLIDTQQSPPAYSRRDEGIDSSIPTTTDLSKSPSGLPLHINKECLFWVIVVTVALIMRLWDLDSRAFHHDESLHAFYSWNMYNGNGYYHNPMMHGPFQFHLNAFVFFLFGDTDFTARLTYAFFGTALVATPLCLRSFLGKYAAMATAILLAFSPTLLYFSRFARNDILMALLTMGLVICIWKYLRSNDQKYLYILSALSASSFATKETTFITMGMLGLFLTVLSMKDIKLLILARSSLSMVSPPTVLLIVLFTLGMTQVSAIAGVFQDAFGIVLINKDPSVGAIGAPPPNNPIISIAISLITLSISVTIGLLWNWRRWSICFAIFSSIWILLHTNFLTDMNGLVSGGWQSLGYWIVQQDVGRGGQPWYYYFVIGSTYEFLSLTVASAAALWYGIRGNRFTRFLVFWAIASFVAFSVASEKMPWLMVHITVPIVLLTGKAIGDLLATIRWKITFTTPLLVGIALIPLFLVLSYRGVIHAQIGTRSSDLLLIAGVSLGLIALAILAWYLMGRQRQLDRSALIILVIVAFLFVIQFRTGWIASYRNGDDPKEMIVYTQSSSDIPRLVSRIDHFSRTNGQDRTTSIVVDTTDGFAWPWVWYLRNHSNVRYTDFGTNPVTTPSPPTVVLLNAQNLAKFNQAFPSSSYTSPIRYRHRVWFPETYRGFTLSALGNSLKDRTVWAKAFDYWLSRDFDTPIGSSDAFYYASNTLDDQQSQ